MVRHGTIDIWSRPRPSCPPYPNKHAPTRPVNCSKACKRRCTTNHKPMPATNENSKRIARNTALLYVRMIFVMAVTLYTSRVVLQALGVTDFGIYNVVGGVVAMFGFLNSAMAAAVQRYVSYELGAGVSERLHTIFCMALVIHVALVVITLILTGSVGGYLLYGYLNVSPDRFQAAFFVFGCSLLSLALTIIQVPYMAFIIANERMGVYAIVTIMETCLKLTGVILLSFYQGDRLICYGLMILFINILVALSYRMYCVRKFSECRFSRLWDKALFKEMFAYSGWSLFGGVASVIPPQGVNLLLNIFFGPAVNAARGVAYQVNSAVASLYSSFTQAVNPQIVKQYSGGNLAYMHQLIFRSCRYTFLLILLLAFPVLLETEQMLHIWLGVVPEHAVAFCRLVLVTTMIDSLAAPLIPAVQATGKIRGYQLIISCLLLLNLPLSYTALKITDIPESCFYVGVGVSALTTGARLLMCRRLISLSLRVFLNSVLLRIVPVVLISAIAFSIPASMPQGYVRLVISVLGGCLLTLLAIWLTGVTQDERALVIRKLNHIKSHICSNR